MKINLIIFISEFNRGGAGNSLFRLCVNLPKKLYNINVICLNECAYEKELKKNSINVFKILSYQISIKKIFLYQTFIILIFYQFYFYLI